MSPPLRSVGMTSKRFPSHPVCDNQLFVLVLFRNFPPLVRRWPDVYAGRQTKMSSTSAVNTYIPFEWGSVLNYRSSLKAG